MTYNRHDAASTMLAEIEAWCARTGTPENHIGHVLFLHPGFVGLMRRRLTVSEEKEQTVHTFMANHPNGWRGELPKTHANGTRTVKRPSGYTARICGERGPLPTTKLTDDEIEARRVARNPCPRCGARGDYGCGHSQVRFGTEFHV